MKQRALIMLLLICLSCLVSSAKAADSINTGEIVTSVASESCIAWRVIGICYWLDCRRGKCRIRTSVKVEHYNPDAVVSSYAQTGDNPWRDLSLLGTGIPGVAEGGGNLITPTKKRDNLPRFKNVDVIGHPSNLFSSEMVGLGYLCPSVTTPFVPYLVSTLDTLAWRYGVPEQVYPEALIPGMREVGSFLTNTWGSVYPRQGFLVQPDDFRAGAVMAQRAADVVTRRYQPHVYLSMYRDPSPSNGYWPPGPVIEGERKTHTWQQLFPTMEKTCSVFPVDASHSTQTSEMGGYTWTLWRPYQCCKKRGQTFLGSVDF